MKQNILVIGGSGKTGRHVVKRLHALGHRVITGSRNGDRHFDWQNPSTYASALKGIERAYIVFYPDLAVPGAKEAIEKLSRQALEEGLKKVVLLSGKGEKEAEACEEIVAKSGLNYTLVRASWFNQNFSESHFLDPILAGHVALPMADVKIPFVDAGDIGEVVAKVLLDDSYNGQTLTLTGPKKITFRDAVTSIADATQRRISFSPISIETYAQGMKDAGLSDDLIWLFSYLFTEVLGNEENQIVTSDVEMVLGRKATEFNVFAQNAAASGVWNHEVNHV